jgi:hypothetical protein
MSLRLRLRAGLRQIGWESFFSLPTTLPWATFWSRLTGAQCIVMLISHSLGDLLSLSPPLSNSAAYFGGPKFK